MLFRIVLVFCLFSYLSSTAQTALNMELFGQFHRGDSRYSGCWVYIDDIGNEYALLGTRTGTAAYGIDESDIEELGFVSGPESNWREITVFGHYAYVTTEGNSDSTGLQIIDLQYLPDSIRLVNTYDLTFTRGHILQKDVYSNEPYIYVSGTEETDGVHILDISDPVNPIEVGLYEPGYYIHDCFVKGDLLFGAAFYESTIDILDISDRSNPVLIERVDHFDGNTHSAWMTEDDRYLMVAAERDGTLARIYNIEDLNDVTEVASWTANLESLAHNPYIRGNYAFVSHNTEGIRVVDLYDPELPVEVAYYDTWEGESGGFRGLWSACPFLPSGKIIGGNREDGLYVWTFNNAKAGRIYARVVEALTEIPLTNVEVLVLETGDTLHTNFEGSFKWGGLPKMLNLSVNADGYETQTIEIDLMACDSLVFDIALMPFDSSASHDNNKKLPFLNLSPNPATDYVKLDLNEWPTARSLVLYNTAGQIVYQIQFDFQTSLYLELPDLNTGVFNVYLLDQSNQALAWDHLLLID